MNLREVSIDRVVVALRSEVPEANLRDATERAEALVAIAERFQVPIDPTLLQWIHYRAPGKQWSGAEWTRYCNSYTETKRALEARGLIVEDEELWTPARCGHCGTLISSVAEARSHVCQMLCPRCYGMEARLVHGRWVCGNCGEVS